MSTISSPLRYPGGKSELGKYIEDVLTANELVDCHFIEPFAGGASATLYLLQRDVIARATIAEYDPLVYAFWYCVFNYSDELCSKIADTPVTLETWNALKPYRDIELPVSTLLVDMGFAGLFFNRTNFSGILNAGPIGGQKQESKYKIDCRFNKDRIIKSIQVLSLYRDRVDVRWVNSLNYLYELHRNRPREPVFLYIDPPYYDKGRSLYRKFFSNEDHEMLAERLIASPFPWLLSYDNCPYISNLYSNNDNILRRQTLYFDYSAGGSKQEKEFLISNLEIPPIEGVKKNPFAVS
ncbi:DNA adenine methylase [Paenibacillus tyrfis]|uniref:DNA adenine methylase n=1 Tax=Paenibacillus tyrfis TaxID=1501230 RepID=UPI000B589E3E|nr:DNA adenine methylase [Paenibacillus tyrfis]